MALDQEQVGQRIKQAREDAGLTQPQLAEKIGVRHPQSVSRYERGVGEVPPMRLRRIAEATGQPLSFFVGEESGLAPADREQLADAVHLLAEVAPQLASSVRQLRELLAGPRAASAPRKPRQSG